MTNTEMHYALIVNARDAQLGSVQRTLLVVDDGYGTTLTVFKGKFPKETVIFKTEQMARDFAQTWIGHPHWYKLIPGEFEIIELKVNLNTDPFCKMHSY
jgi:hypothetical protein